jgi:Mg2+ and Co2+ transporter CorA
MLRSLLCDEHGQFLVVEDLDTISDIIARTDRHLWLDVEKPSVEEMGLIKEEFDLHPLAVEDAMQRHQRPKVDQYTNFYFVVFYAVTSLEPNVVLHPGEPTTSGRRGLRGTRFHEPGDLSGQAQPDGQVDSLDDESLLEHIVVREISMFLGRNYLITVHMEPVPEFEEVAQRWFRNAHDMAAEMGTNRLQGTRELTPGEAAFLTPAADPPTSKPEQNVPQLGAVDLGSATPPKPRRNKRREAFAAHKPPDRSSASTGASRDGAHSNHIGLLLYSLLDTIVDSYFPLIDRIVDRVEDLEEQIFENFNQHALESVFTLKKDLLLMRKVLAPERDVLNVLTRRDIPIFDERTIVYFQDVYDHVVRITESIDTYRDLLTSALDSFLSMQSNRLNSTLQTLTSVSIILMSIAAFTGWYGMNFEFMPELHSVWGYPLLIGVVATIVGLEMAFFKRKGWL